MPPILTLILILVAWQVYVRVFNVASYLVPAPSEIWTAFNQMRGVLPGDVRTTLAESVLGLLFGGFAGAVVATLLWAWPLARRALYPLLITSQTIPMVVLSPLLVVWFGLGLTPKVVVVALITFFPVSVAMVQGLTNTDPELLDLLKTMGASRLTLGRYVLLPSAAPSFFAGMRIAASYTVAGAVIGEWVGSTSGLGLLLTQSQRSFRVDRVFAATAVVAITSICLFLLVDLAARFAMPWTRSSRKELHD